MLNYSPVRGWICINPPLTLFFFLEGGGGFGRSDLDKVRSYQKFLVKFLVGRVCKIKKKEKRKDDSKIRMAARYRLGFVKIYIHIIYSWLKEYSSWLRFRRA